MHPHPRLSSSQLVASALGNCGDPSGQSTNCLHSTSPNASCGRYMLYWVSQSSARGGAAAPTAGMSQHLEPTRLNQSDT